MAQNLKHSPTKVHYSNRTRVSSRRQGDVYGQYDPITRKRHRRTPSNDALLARLMKGY